MKNNPLLDLIGSYGDEEDVEESSKILNNLQTNINNENNKSSESNKSENRLSTSKEKLKLSREGDEWKPISIIENHNSKKRKNEEETKQITKNVKSSTESTNSSPQSNDGEQKKKKMQNLTIETQKMLISKEEEQKNSISTTLNEIEKPSLQNQEEQQIQEKKRIRIHEELEKLLPPFEEKESLIDPVLNEKVKKINKISKND